MADYNNYIIWQEYRNLCETTTKKIEFNDPVYEYQPPFYREVYCKNYVNQSSREQRDVATSVQVNLWLK